MSELKIENDLLTAKFNSKGAELTSLRDAQREYIWQADPQHWGKHSPILFPIIGQLKDGAFEHKGKSYNLSRHGFARDMDFIVTEHEGDRISFELTSTNNTLQVYPFDFKLIVKYVLLDDVLKTQYVVENIDSQEMLFSLGGHPAFNCPMEESQKRSDYQLIFDINDSPESYILENGLLGNHKTNHFSEDGSLKIKDDLFNDDALIFKNSEFGSATLVHEPSENAYFTMHFDGFPYLGIWSKDNKSPFVCIEPWFGVADGTDHNQQLASKEGIVKLPMGQRFVCGYAIETY